MALLRIYLAPTLVGLASIAAFVWYRLAPGQVEETLMAHRSALYLGPWRSVASCFVHTLFPHLLFNLITLMIAGIRVIRKGGNTWFGLCFVSGAFIGQIVHTLIAQSGVYGISGGVCALYGFLLRREWQGTLLATIKGWWFFWVYPVALLALFVADTLDVFPVANVNHLVGIAVGWLLAAGFGRSGQRIWKAAFAAIATVSLLLLLYRPWDPVWRAVWGRYHNSERLVSYPCDQIQLPDEGVSSAPPVMVTVLNPSLHRLTFYYFDRDARLIRNLQTKARVRAFRPLRGSSWRIVSEEAGCETQFKATRDGVVELRDGPLDET